MENFKTDLKNKYYEYFNKNIVLQVKPFEKIRKKMLFKTISLTLLFFLVGFFVAVLMLYLFWIEKVNLIIWTVLFFVMCLFLFRSLTYQMQTAKEFDKILISGFLKYFLVPFANFKNWPKNLNTGTLLNSRLFRDFEEQEDKESYFGFYNASNVILSKTFLVKPSRTGEKSYVFKGLLIQLELDKSFNNHVIIQSKNEVKLNPYKNISVKTSYKEYLNFYVKNENSSLKLFEDDLLECIENIAIAFNAMAIKCSVNENIVLIAVTTKKNPFKICSLFKSLCNVKNYDDFFKRFISIFALVSVIKSKQA